MSAGKRERLFANHDLVETFGIQLLPRQIEQIEIAEQCIERLTFAQTADVMKAGIELGTAAPKCLQATADARIVLQHSNLKTIFSQNIAALQAAKSAAYDYNTFHGACF